MTKVLEKTFDILEILSNDPGREFSVSELAAFAKLNKATSGRILSDLCKRGYAFQSAFRGGYSLGPMAYSLSAKGVFRKDLVDAAHEIVRSFAHEEIKESVILATLHRGRRYILLNENGNKEVQPVIDMPWYDDMYITATGRLLLAHASPSEIEGYIATHPLPCERWPEASDADALRALLDGIRTLPALSMRSPNTCFWVMAFPVRNRGRVDAALGITVLAESLSEERKAWLLTRGLACAEAIETSSAGAAK